MTTEEKIWQRLKAAGYNDFGIAGLMGNLGRRRKDLHSHLHDNKSDFLKQIYAEESSNE